jgi:actin-like ATPase involved in cell morphogenesis
VSSNDQRKHTRYEVCWEIEVSAADWGDVLTLTTTSVSQGGLFIVASTPPKPGEPLTVSIALPDDNKVKITGEVVRTVEPGSSSGEPVGFAIRFDREKSSDLVLLESMAAAFGAPEPGSADERKAHIKAKVTTTQVEESAFEIVASGEQKPVELEEATEEKKKKKPPTLSGIPAVEYPTGQGPEGKAAPLLPQMQETDPPEAFSQQPTVRRKVDELLAEPPKASPGKAAKPKDASVEDIALPEIGANVTKEPDNKVERSRRPTPTRVPVLLDIEPEDEEVARSRRPTPTRVPVLLDIEPPEEKPAAQDDQVGQVINRPDDDLEAPSSSATASNYDVEQQIEAVLGEIVEAPMPPPSQVASFEYGIKRSSRRAKKKPAPEAAESEPAQQSEASSTPEATSPAGAQAPAEIPLEITAYPATEAEAQAPAEIPLEITAYPATEAEAPAPAEEAAPDKKADEEPTAEATPPAEEKAKDEAPAEAAAPAGETADGETPAEEAQAEPPPESEVIATQSEVQDEFEAPATLQRSGEEAEAFGIDFGTSYCSIGVDFGGVVEVLEDSEGHPLLPSAVSYPEQGSPVLGWAAREQLLTHPSTTFTSPKRVIGRDYNDPKIEAYLASSAVHYAAGPNGQVMAEVYGHPMTMVQVGADIFRHIARIGEYRADRPVRKVALAAPVAFEGAQRQAISRAATIAGMEVVGIIDEPVAAALAYGASNNKDEQIAVFDFGGGTFDFTILRSGGNRFEVIGEAGDAWLGGDDFDLALGNYAADEFWKKTKVDLRKRQVEWQRLLFLCERAKRQLTFAEEATLEAKSIALSIRGGIDLKVPLSRTLFADLCGELVTRAIDTMETCFMLSGVDTGDIDQVVMTGGVSRIPMVHESVEKFFGTKIELTVNPEQAIVIGASLFAHQTAGKRETAE